MDNSILVFKISSFTGKPGSSTTRPGANNVFDTDSSANIDSQSLSIVNLSPLRSCAAWQQFHLYKERLREHKTLCQSPRSIVHRLFMVAQYRSQRPVKHGQSNESLPFEAFMTAVEKVRIKIDICLDSRNLLQNVGF